MKVKTHHRAASVFWLMIGGYIAVHAYQLGLGGFRRPGPGLVFFISALLFIALTAIDLAGTFVGESERGKGNEEPPPMGGGAMAKGPGRPGRFIRLHLRFPRCGLYFIHLSSDGVPL